tara:strand:- start:449 stop:667 length:219 start_codon:yes stop_codon:yes gene_type:complete
MKGVKYNCIINDKVRLEGLEMSSLCENINKYSEENYNGLIEVTPNKIYNLIKRPKLVSKNLKKLLKVEYSKP